MKATSGAAHYADADGRASAAADYASDAYADFAADLAADYAADGVAADDCDAVDDSDLAATDRAAADGSASAAATGDPTTSRRRPHLGRRRLGRPPLDFGGGGKGGGYDKGGKGDFGKGGKDGGKPGDWPCPSCGANNFARRTDCFNADCVSSSGVTQPGQTSVLHRLHPQLRMKAMKDMKATQATG